MFWPIRFALDYDHLYYNVEIGFWDPHTCSHSAGLFWSRDLKTNGASRSSTRAFSESRQMVTLSVAFERLRTQATAYRQGQRVQIGLRANEVSLAAEHSVQWHLLAGMTVICS